MRHIMKRIVTILVAASMAGSLIACSAGTASETAVPQNTGTVSEPQAAEAEEAVTEEPIKVGVATIHEGEVWEVQKKYYVEEVAPALNMEFIFSEYINDANDLVDFIDQCYAAGAKGIINYRTQDEAVQQGARKCEEYGMYFMTQSSKVTADVNTLEYNMGHCGSDPIALGDNYKTLFKDLLADGELHSIVIFTCGAVGKMAASHYYSVYAMLEAYQEAYGLTFDDTIENIIMRTNPGEVDTGRSDLKIYLYPGVDFDAATIGVQTALQTGDYDTFAAVASFSVFTSAVDEVEKALGKDIRLIATANLDEPTKTAFETMDSFGNPILNAALINPFNPANGVDSVMLYNGLHGGAANMKDNGSVVFVGVTPYVCTDAATYNALSALDRDHATYILDADALKALTVTENPAMTYADIENKLAEIADLDTVLTAKGLK